MKIPANYEIEEFSKAIGVGFLRGAAVGGVASAGIITLLKRRTSFFQMQGTFHRMLTVFAPVLFCGATSMEFASRDFEEHQRLKLEGIKPISEPHRSVMTYDSVYNWIGDNKYKCIVAGWAASMYGSWHYINKDKYMTRSQKLVQARVYAQGVTVIMLVASVLLSVQTSKDEQKRKETEKQRTSWERDLQYVKKE